MSIHLSLIYLPIKWIVKQQKPKFGKIILSWLMVLEFDKHHKRASPDLSTYIYSSISISTYIYIYAYISCLHGISCSDPHLEHHSFPDLSIYIYLSTYIHAYISCLHGISCSDPHLEHHCFECSSFPLSNTYPSNGLSNNKNPKFCKMLVFAWWCWNLTDITRELALIYPSISIHLFLYLHK